MSETAEMTGYKAMVGHAVGFADSGKARFLKTFDAVGDDKKSWTPAEGAKTPIQLGAHVAVSNDGFAGMIAGGDGEMPEMDVLMKMMAEAEAKLDTPEKVTAAIEESHTKLMAVLNGLSEERFNAAGPEMMGGMKIGELIFYIGTHYYSHASQVDYVQTCYGDHNFYM